MSLWGACSETGLVAVIQGELSIYGDPLMSTKIHLYDDETYLLVGTVNLPRLIGTLDSYVGEGRFVYFDRSGQRLVSIVEYEDADEHTEKFAISVH